MDAVDRITGAGPWRNTKGEMVFANRAQLQTHPMQIVGYAENGSGLYPVVWTGTDVGRVAPPEFTSDTTSTCADWTTNSAATARALTGDSGQASNEAWTNNGYGACFVTHALYCLSIAP